jgi:DNA-binding beta-propeller fold protein YncE
MKKTALILLAISMLIGCATAPEKVEIVFYPPLPEKPRIQFLRGISNEDDLGGGKKQSAFETFLLGEAEVSKRAVKSPYDIETSNGKVYISDRSYKRIIIIDLIEQKFDQIHTTGAGKLAEPAGIWVTRDDVKYVTDMRKQQVLVYDKNNNFLRAYGGKEQFLTPVDVAVYENNIYVCDMKKHSVFILDKDSGKVKGTIGGRGSSKVGQFNRPTRVIVDHLGNIYVNDAFNYRMQKFDPRGNFIQTYGVHGDGLGTFARPKGLAIDREGHLYVADGAFQNVQIFDDDLAQVVFFFGGGQPGSPGKMSMPNDVHIDYANVEYFTEFVDKDFKIRYVIYVGNRYGPARLNIYGFGEWVGPSLTEPGG